MALIHGWRASILITAIVNLIALVIVILFTKEKRDIHPAKITFKTFRNVDIWILGIAWALFNMAMLGYSTWGKTVFTRYYGLSLEFSDLLAGMLMIGAFIQPLSGYISDIIGKRRFLIIISQASIFVLILIYPKLPTTYFLILALLIGLIASFIIPNIFALSGELLGVKKGALGFGITNTFLNLGIILGPLSLGYVLDSTDSSSFFFLSMAIFVLLGLIFSSILKS
jgi:predicted MFS family arabinose efflux permease